MSIKNYQIIRLQEKQKDYLGGRFTISQQANLQDKISNI